MLGYVDLCVFLELSLTTFMSTSYCNCSVNFKHHHQRGTVALSVLNEAFGITSVGLLG